jgi:hypothetical protein
MAMGGLLSDPVRAGAASDVTIEKTDFGGWSECYKVSNGAIDLVVVAEIGPRIVWFGFTGGDNEFHVWKETLGQKGGLEWLPYGGHRLWVAPEAQPRTYYPDNVPVSAKTEGKTLRLTAPVERNPQFEGSSGVQKEILIKMDGKNSVTVIHRVTNRNVWTVDLAIWALTFMRPGGRLIVPSPEYGPHPENLLPVRTLTLWKYTEIGDPQFHWGNRYITLKQDSARKNPNKFGVANTEGWAAYQRDDHLFVKSHEHKSGLVYPDMGCSLEAFTNNEILEFETLGPMIKLAPGETGEHIERWRLFKDVKATEDEDTIDREVKARVFSK